MCAVQQAVRDWMYPFPLIGTSVRYGYSRFPVSCFLLGLAQALVLPAQQSLPGPGSGLALLPHAPEAFLLRLCNHKSLAGRKAAQIIKKVKYICRVCQCGNCSVSHDSNITAKLLIHQSSFINMH